MFKIAWRHLIEHKIRTLLTMTGILLGVALVLAVGILNQSMLDSYIKIFTQSSGKGDIMLRKSNGFRESDLRQIEKLPGIEKAIPIMEVSFQLEGTGEEGRWISLNGVDIQEERNFRDYYFKDGGWFTSPKDNQIIITEKAAKETGTRVGGSIKLATWRGMKEYTVIGILAEKGAGVTMWENLKGFVPIDNLRNMMNWPGGINRVDVHISDVDTVLNKTEQIRTLFPEELNTTTIKDNMERMEENLSSMKLGYNVVLAVIFFVGCFLIYNTFTVAILQRIKLIGMMKTIGMNRGQTIRMVLVEGFFLGVLGTLFGMGFGILLGKYLVSVQSREFQTDFNTIVVPSISIVQGIITGFAMPVIAVLIPGIKASKYKPMEALRIDDAMYQQKKKMGFIRRNRFWIGSALFLVAAVGAVFSFKLENEMLGATATVISLLMFLVGITMITPEIMEAYSRVLTPVMVFLFGKEGILSSRNILRNKGRAGITVSIIAVGLAMAIGFNGMFNSLNRSMHDYFTKAFTYDIGITSKTGSIQEYDKIQRKLKNLSRVKDYTYTFAGHSKTLDRGNQWILTLGVKPMEYKKIGNLDLKEGDGDQVFRDLESHPDSVVISTRLRDELKLGMGDTLYLRVMDAKIVPFRIVGVMVDYDWSGYKVLVNREVLDKVYRYSRVSSILIRAADGTDFDALAKELTDVLDNDDLNIQTIYQQRQSFYDNWNIASGTFDIINWVSLLVAIFGLANTLVMSIYERKKEIGILRSIGTGQGQVRKIIYGESLMLGILSALIGISAGAVFTAIMAKGMAAMSKLYIYVYYPFGFMAISFALVLAASILAAIYPAHLAARSNMIQAIKND